LATLVYFERASKQLTGRSSKTDKWIQDAFRILSDIGDCNTLFPLFIFAREARSDDRRLLILQVIDRTIPKETSMSTIAWLRQIVVKFWVQDDLCADQSAGQLGVMCSILQFSDSVPCLL
jgi:hypothetical protein